MIDANEVKEYLESIVGDFPICEFAFGDPAMIEISDKVHTICETDCTRFGHCWACPPNAGSILDNINRLKNYKNFCLFSTVWEVENSWDLDQCFAVRKDHEEATRAMREQVLSHFGLEMESLAENGAPPVYFLSAGCAICDECACPDEPCRHPKERLMSMESHGILIMKLTEDVGMTFSFGINTVVYFTIILF